jgi:hypothetical protein
MDRARRYASVTVRRWTVEAVIEKRANERTTPAAAATQDRTVDLRFCLTSAAVCRRSSEFIEAAACFASGTLDV